MPTVFRPGKAILFQKKMCIVYVLGAECITLNEDETKIFNLLKECCQALHLDVTLRVAGGWVRDKVITWNFPRYHTAF